MMRDTIIITTMVASALSVSFASVHGARGISEIYGDSERFGAVTLIAISAHRWSPFLFIALLLGYLWMRVFRKENAWASWCALSLTALTTALVLYGIISPFASTNFQMSH
jgi:hypothetical protein